MNNYYVYMVHTSADKIYTGITVDVRRRIREHNESNKRGAKALRGQRPVTLTWTSELMTRSSALKLEAQIKKMSRKDKEKFIGR